MRHYRLFDDVLLAGVLLLSLLSMAASGLPGCSEVGPPHALSQDVEDAPVPVLRGLRRDDYLLAAQACVHENGWRGGVDGTFDCGAQIQTFLTRRFQNETLRAVIMRTMPRFSNGSTSRAWVRELPLGPLRVDPAGWPAPYPARHDDDAWHGVVLRVRDFLTGREPLPCAEPPEHWFGRLVDHEAIQARLDSGRWVAADCNPGGAPETQTLNLYLTAAVR